MKLKPVTVGQGPYGPDPNTAAARVRRRAFVRMGGKAWSTTDYQLDQFIQQRLDLVVDDIYALLRYGSEPR